MKTRQEHKEPEAWGSLIFSTSLAASECQWSGRDKQHSMNKTQQENRARREKYKIKDWNKTMTSEAKQKKEN